MKIIEQSWQFLSGQSGEILKIIEAAGRTCYKSEDRITDTSSQDFCRKIIKSGHHSVIEHHNVTVRIITDRGVTHEIVRHRLASYSQESTRYCNYRDAVTFILPVWLTIPPGFYDRISQCPGMDYASNVWFHAMLVAESKYSILLDRGWSPQQARSVLPNSLKTEIVMTCNIREWRHFFTLRCSKAAHPQMRELAVDMLRGFKGVIPVLFDDIWEDAA